MSCYYKHLLKDKTRDVDMDPAVIVAALTETPKTPRLLARQTSTNKRVVNAVLANAAKHDPRIKRILRSPYNSVNKRPAWLYSSTPPSNADSAPEIEDLACSPAPPSPLAPSS